MKIFAFAVAFAATAAPAAATIDQWTFMGHGKVTVRNGPMAPALNAANSFSGRIMPLGSPPANGSTGSVNPINDGDTYWEADDNYMFSVDNWNGPGAVGSYAWTNGGLTSFNLGTGDGISGYLNVFTTGFQGWLYDPFDSANDSYYAGKWDFVSTTAYRIGNNGDLSTTTTVLVDKTVPPLPTVPEPASWAMLITGFGLVGAAARRRRADEVALA